MPPAKATGAPRRPLLFALDPGFAALGGALLDRDGALVEVDTCRTEPAPRPRKAAGSWSAQDRARRAGAAWSWLLWMKTSADQDGELVAWAAEANPAGKGADALIALGVASGLVGAYAQQIGLPPVLELPGGHDRDGWRRAYLQGYFGHRQRPAAAAAGAADQDEAIRRRTRARAANRKAEDAALYAAIGDSLTPDRRVGPNGESTVREFALGRLKTWARRPSTLVHALDAIGLGRWALTYHPTVRAAMGLAAGERPRWGAP
jgi:hypothetical protein